jgi:hypothetical protein
MAVLTRITDDKAEGQVAEVFAAFTAAVGGVPKPLRMLAGSPGLFMQQVGLIGYYRNHPHLDSTLLACIRYLSAEKLNYQACIEFNGSLLQKQGMSEAELAAMTADPMTAPLSEREKSLLVFVLKGVAGEVAGAGDIDQLKAAGWLESDIIDAANQGIGMMTHGRMLGFFGMDE